MSDAADEEQAAFALLAENLVRAGSALRAAYEKSPGLRVPPAGIELMGALFRGGPMTVSEIARTLDKYPSNVSATIRTLLELDLIERVTDGRDGRVVRVRPSRKSHAVHAHLVELWARNLGTAADELPRAERRRLLASIDALGRLADHLERNLEVVDDFDGIQPQIGEGR